MKYAEVAGDEAARRCLCCWSDLLGFGNRLRESRFSKVNSVVAGMDRVRRFERALRESYYAEIETVLIVNDGAARNYDYRDRESVNSVLRWLAQLFLAHNAVNEVEMARGEPGLRSILAAGERATYNRGDRTLRSVGIRRCRTASLKRTSSIAQQFMRHSSSR
jgi:hypothetical protein